MCVAFRGIEDWGARLLASTGQTWDAVKDGRAGAGAVEVAVVRNAYARGLRQIDQVAANRLRASGATAGPCRFTLLIPDASDRKAAKRTLEVALPLMRRAAVPRSQVLVGGPDPFRAVDSAFREGNFDEIIVSTLPKRTSRWPRRDLVSRVEELGLPVTAVIPDVVRDPTAGMAAFRG